MTFPGTGYINTGFITPFILAGGEGSRMGLYGEYCPKPLMVAYNQSLLHRNLSFLASAGFHQIIVSTRESLYERIYQHVDSISKKDDNFQNVNLRVLCNPQHQPGSLEALRWGLDHVTTSWTLMCFSDIFFISNPFGDIYLSDENSDMLGKGPITSEMQLKKGGILYQNNGEVEGIFERPCTDLRLDISVRWNGIALFKTESARYDLDQFFTATKSHGLPEGDFFEYRRLKGRKITCHGNSDFININTIDDLYMASLYAGREKLFLKDNRDRESVFTCTQDLIRMMSAHEMEKSLI